MNFKSVCIAERRCGMREAGHRLYSASVGIDLSGRSPSAPAAAMRLVQDEDGAHHRRDDPDAPVLAIFEFSQPLRSAIVAAVRGTCMAVSDNALFDASAGCSKRLHLSRILTRRCSEVWAPRTTSSSRR
jgi:hypothetical protein